MRDLPVLVIMVAAALPVVAQTRVGSSASVTCRGKACQSFKQLAKANDADVKVADVACFYDGENPASKDKDEGTVDEFFLLMYGRRSTMNNGLHPGIFVNIVKDGQPEGYRGYGPKRGGLGESDDVMVASLFEDGKAGLASTYDDLGETIRFAAFFFGPERFWSGKEVAKTGPVLRTYEETQIRTSTGRFVQKMIDFDSRFVEKTGTIEPGPWSAAYHGQCFVMKHRR